LVAVALVPVPVVVAAVAVVGTVTAGRGLVDCAPVPGAVPAPVTTLWRGLPPRPLSLPFSPSGQPP
jgi:hypothetical protein